MIRYERLLINPTSYDLRLARPVGVDEESQLTRL